MLYSIIDLLLKENGLKIGSASDHYEDLEKVEKIETYLSENIETNKNHVLKKNSETHKVN